MNTVMNDMTTMTPFDNDHEVLTIGGLTIENGLDTVALFGELTIAKSKDGLAQAKALQAISSQLVAVLEQMTDLPDEMSVATAQVEEIDNPFA